MLSVIKEIGIFIVIAQAILYFVPGETYVKYVKVLIGVMMIAKMVSPVFSLLSEEGTEEMMLQWDEFLEKSWEEQGEIYMEGFGKSDGEIEGNSAYEEIYFEIGKEIKKILNQNPAEGYAVEQVRVIQEGEEYEIVLSVVRTMETEEKERPDERELEIYYAEILQTGNVTVQIIG